MKNSSMPVQDIQMFKMEGGKDFVVFNGPDEQLVSGLAMGADGGIGGTYGVMPELYLKYLSCAGKESMRRRERSSMMRMPLFMPCAPAMEIFMQ